MRAKPNVSVYLLLAAVTVLMFLIGFAIGFALVVH